MEARDARAPRREAILAQLSGPLIGSLLSFLLALLLASLAIAVAGFDVIAGYRAMVEGVVGTRAQAADVLARATPLMFTGLSVAIALHAGLFNVGAEGQLLLGAMAAALVGLVDGLPRLVHIPLALLAAATAGSLLGLVPAFLKARFGAHEVITTIMLNYVVILFTGYLANYTFHPASEMMPATGYVAPSARFPPFVAGSQLTSAVLLGVGCAVVLSFLLRRTVQGYEIRAVGLNPQAARAGGISQARIWAVTMAIGGAMAGLGGAAEVLSVHRRFIEGFSPGYGFDGIAVALIGFQNPIGTVPAAILLGAIRAGALTMDRTTRIPADFVTVIQALMLLVLAVPGLSQLFLRRRRPHL